MLPIYKLTSGYADADGSYREFNFRNEERKERFMRTVYAHRLNVEFSEEQLQMKPTRELLIELEKDPIEYALESLDWAKTVLRKCDITEKEWAYIRSIA